jgi:hypothetical protein
VRDAETNGHDFQSNDPDLAILGVLLFSFDKVPEEISVGVEPKSNAMTEQDWRPGR